MNTAPINELWMIPTYRARTWAYVQAPKVGDAIRYVNDGFDVTVQKVRRRYFLFSDGTVMRRRITGGMMWEWIVGYNLRISGWWSRRGKRETWVHAGSVLYHG